MSDYWYIAVEPFGPESGERWHKYTKWSGLHHIQRLITLDSVLCPPILGELSDEDWKYNVQADFLIDFFLDLNYLKSRIPNNIPSNLLQVMKNPRHDVRNDIIDSRFTFIGYDLLDKHNSISTLTNCGGFPDIFNNDELSNHGLLTEYSRAIEIRDALFKHYPNHGHTDCEVWAIWLIKDKL